MRGRISELVTNAVRHTCGPGTLRLTHGPGGVEVAVSDTSRLLPQPRVADTDTALNGRGLALVAALCDAVSVSLDTGSGKTVRAHLAPLPSAPPSRPAPVAARPPGPSRNW
ncbi:ATP-binding protein [Kitasatospora sp. NPDC059571]|uniref:ATP-binding protein n=1 Tax=Kitasatospora sp. NPDC059571 TaxID=3346871 RepID=UPI00369A23B7